MVSRFALALALFCCSSCITYDFTPLDPTLTAQTTVLFSQATLDKPDLFMVVDKSGSMNFGVAAAGCNCPNGGCPAACPTRMSELKSAMAPFLAAEGGNEHFGMVPFPRDAVCGGAVTSDIATLGVDLDQSADTDPVAMQRTANSINARIQALSASGGTPTAASLGALLNYPLLINDRNHQRFALLLTDGLPNCNSANDPQATTCTCTVAKPTPASACSVTGTNQCLDDTGTVAAIQQLAAAGIRTIVVGFGAETQTGLGPQTLDALGAAGGFVRGCAVDADCGAGDTCSGAQATGACGQMTRTCGQHYYQAGNAGELGKALAEIRSSLSCSDPCFFQLTSRPSDARYLAVRVDDKSIPSINNWVYDPVANTVRFNAGSASCNALSTATASNPVKLEFRIIETY